MAVKKAMKKPRSSAQNRSLHLWMRQLSDALNTAGLDQRKVLKANLDIPWNEESVKTNLWLPVMTAMLGIESTAEAETKDYDQVYSVLSKHLSEKLGVTAPVWPDHLGKALEHQSTERWIRDYGE